LLTGVRYGGGDLSPGPLR